MSHPGDHSPPAADDEEELSAAGLRNLVAFAAPFFRPYRRVLLVIAVVLAVEGLFNAAVSLSLKILIDDALLERNAGVLVGVVVALGVIGLIVSVAGVACDYLNARLIAHANTPKSAC